MNTDVYDEGREWDLSRLHPFANRMKCIAGIDAQTGEDYLRRHVDRYTKAWQMIPSLPVGSTCLDIGTSPFSRGLQLFFGFDVTCLDHHDLWTSACESADPPIPVVLRDLNELITSQPYESLGSFDLITCLEVIEHIGLPPQEIFDFFRNQLVQGGYILITTPNLARMKARLRLLSGRSPVKALRRYGEGSLSHVREYVMDELIDALEQASYVIEDARFEGSPSSTAAGKIHDVMCEFHPPLKQRLSILARVS